jgi:hypothetical protein
MDIPEQDIFRTAFSKFYTFKIQIQSKCESVKSIHWIPWPDFFFVWQLRVSWCGAPSLTRGCVCNLLVQLLLVLAKAVTLGSKSRRTHDPILLSHLRLPQPRGPGPRIYIPQEQGGPVLSTGTAYDSQGYGGSILTSLHTGVTSTILHRTLHAPSSLFPSRFPTSILHACLVSRTHYTSHAFLRLLLIYRSLFSSLSRVHIP